MAVEWEDNIFFLSEFDDMMDRGFPAFAEEIKKQSEKNDGYVDLYITSQGGNYYYFLHWLELIEAAKRIGVVVRTIVPAAAFSAGSMLAVAGTIGERYIGRDAEHLVHYGFALSGESTPKQNERNNAWKDRSFRAVVKHYKKYCDIPNLEEHLSDDYGFIVARDCIKYKMADKYMDKFEI